MSDHDSALEAREELAEAVSRLGRDEVRVLTHIARRLSVGAALYGTLDLARDRRAFRNTEAREEMAARPLLPRVRLAHPIGRRISMNAKGCRRKGHDFERAVVRLLASVFGDDLVRRGLQYRDGIECADVIAPGLWVECKAQQQTNPRAALAQALRGAEGHDLKPVAICKDDRLPPVVMMRLEHFLQLLREWHERRVTVSRRS